MKNLKKIALFSTLACAAFTAQAHRAFLVPSSTVVAGNAPWVTVDAAAATDVFVFDHNALKLDNLFITAPDGSALKPENASTGKYRSTFDVKLSQTGSYRIGILNEGLFASYKEEGKVKRWRGTAETFAKEVPANAPELQVTQRSGRIETFVTNGKPGGKSMDISGSGLEMSGATHPNDLVAGETAQFRLTLDGKPAAKVSVTLIAGGLRYRQKLDEKTFETDSEGKFSVTWGNAGMYWLEAEIKDDKQVKAPAKSRVATYVATLEVLPQ